MRDADVLQNRRAPDRGGAFRPAPRLVPFRPGSRRRACAFDRGTTSRTPPDGRSRPTRRPSNDRRAKTPVLLVCGRQEGHALAVLEAIEEDVARALSRAANEGQHTAVGAPGRRGVHGVHFGEPPPGLVALDRQRPSCRRAWSPPHGWLRNASRSATGRSSVAWYSASTLFHCSGFMTLPERIPTAALD